MVKTLVILAHPNTNTSIANIIICEEVNKLKNVEVRDIAKLYPDFSIDIEAEQAALIDAEKIVFQYPIYWYNMPSILKQWFDQVLTYGFAFGEGGYKLEGKEMMVSVTTGQPMGTYANGILTDKILYPLEEMANYCKMRYVDPLALHGFMLMHGMELEPFEEAAKFHAQKLINILK